MAGATAILAIRMVANTREAVQGLGQTADAAARTEAAMNKIKAGAAVAVAGVAMLAKQSIDAASRLQQAAGGMEAVYGSMSAEVEKFAATSVKAMGLSKAAYLEFATSFGGQLSGLGIPMDQVAGKSNELIQLGADLAATYGGTTAEAVAALGSLFRGEADPIERWNVSIKQSDVNARLAAEGMSHLEGEAKKQAETQARMALLYEQTTAAQGGFARETGTLANSQQQATASMEDAKAAIGEGLLPIMTKLGEVMQGVGNFAREHPALFQAIIGVVAALTAAYVAYSIAATVAAVAQAGLLWPILAVIAVIAALIAIIYLVITNMDKLGAVWNAVWSACSTAVQATWSVIKTVASWIGGAFMSVVRSIGTVFTTAFNIARSVINTVLAPIRAVISAISDLIGWIGRIKWPSPPGWLSSLNPFSAVAPVPTSAVRAPYAYTGAGVGASSPLRSKFAPVMQINITGALDPISVGRQVDRVMHTYYRHDAQIPAIRMQRGPGEVG